MEFGLKTFEILLVSSYGDRGIMVEIPKGIITYTDI